MRVLVTGAAGFLGRYITTELLGRGHEVTGVDNFSRHSRPDDPGYRLVEADCRDTDTMRYLLTGQDHLIAAAAMVGGIAYFHKYPYDLLAANERISAAAADAAISAFQGDCLRKVTWVSSSMVYERSIALNSSEGDELSIPPPLSSYGFSKLACEYFARAAWDQYQLPYTIVRPFNCVGVGEARDDAHVIPDLVRKVLEGQDPLEIYGNGRQVRHFTHGSDLARGICDAMEAPQAINEDFNLASREGLSVLSLARLIWGKLRYGSELRYVSVPRFEHDVQWRVPSVAKAGVGLGWEAKVGLDEMVDEVIAWLRG